MRFLVCQPKGEALCKVWITDDATQMLVHPFETWAIRSGRQLLFIEREMPKLLTGFHMGGSYYDGGATYMVTYEEMNMIFTEKMGPCDRVRCDELVIQKKYVRHVLRNDQWIRSSRIGLRIFGSVLYIGWLGVKLVLFILIFPFFIMWLNRTRK